MTLSDNPIGASYLYLSEPEIRFLEAAVEHLIPTDELGPERAMLVWWSISTANWPAPGASTAVNIAAAHGWRARRSRAINRASRRKKCIALQFARSTSTAEPSSTGLSRGLRATGNWAILELPYPGEVGMIDLELKLGSSSEPSPGSGTK